MKKLVILLLCVAIVGTGGFFGYKKYRSSQDEKKVVDVVPVSLMAESADMYEWYSSDLSGQIVSANSQKIYVDSQKLVKKVLVKKGDEVKKGDTILEYDMTVVELELAQKENQVGVIEAKIKTANKELNQYKTLQPSENEPNTEEPYEPEEPDIPEEPDVPEEPVIAEPSDSSETDEPDIPITPVQTVDSVNPTFVPAAGTGTAEDPYIINCGENTKVTTGFMARISATNRFAELCVYDENSRFLYKWMINSANLSTKDMKEWVVSDGVEINEETGLIALNTDITHYGTFSVKMPDSIIDSDDSSENDSMLDAEIPDPADITDIPDDTDDYDYSDENYDYDYNDDDADPYDMNYVYSRAELDQMIAEKQNEIKSLEIDLRKAKIEYENAKKQKSDGKVVAEVDGIVKKIGTTAGENSENEEGSEDETYEDDMTGEDEEYSGDSDAFAVIEGDGGVEVRCEVTELNLQNTPVGGTVNVMSWETGASTEAEVTRIDEEPYMYSNWSWGENPNNSTYYVYAKLEDSTEFTVGNWVQVSLNQTQSSDSNSVYLPIQYVRQEGGDYYIMKADENNRLVKQYVKAGKIMYGYAIEIKGGLSMSDKICFPFGTDVKEGVRTKDSTEILYPENYY